MRGPYVYTHTGIQLHNRRVEALNPREPEISLLDALDAVKPAWMKHPRRNCRFEDPRLFFGDNQSTGVLICDGCPVRHECLTYGLTTAQYGVWGGTTDTDRREMRIR